MVGVDSLRAALLASPPPLPAGPQLRPAAVLVPLLSSEAGLQLILTRRSDQLRQHAGQVSFPGGKQDSSDPSLVDTALREAEEEINLRRESVEIQGFLPSIETGTNFAILPVVGLVQMAPGEQLADRLAQLRPEAGEVAQLWAEPLSRFLASGAFVTADIQFAGRILPGHLQVAGSKPVIWGATARILKNLADRLAISGKG